MRGMVKGAMERRLTWYECDVEVTKPEPGNVDGFWTSILATVVVRPH